MTVVTEDRQTSATVTTGEDREIHKQTSRLIRDPAFAKRLESACEAHPHAPDKHFGQLRWLQEQMARVGEHVSPETCRKWLAGEARPRPVKMEKLAQALEVDPAWLALGIDPVMQTHERRIRNAMADGAVNLVAGLIQMDSGYPAFPDETDKRAQEDNVDLYAIIKGQNYAFHVVLGERQDDKQLRFVIPARHENVVVLGVIRDSSFRLQAFELPKQVIKAGFNRGGSIEIVADAKALRKIESFRERL